MHMGLHVAPTEVYGTDVSVLIVWLVLEVGDIIAVIRLELYV